MQKKISLKFKKTICLIVTVIMLFASSSTMLVANATSVSNIKQLLNSSQLSPIKTNDKKVDEKVQSILGKITNNSMSTYDKVKACYDYIIKNFYYITPVYMELEQYLAEYVSEYDGWLVCEGMHGLAFNVGVCNNYSAAFVLLTRAIGLESYRFGGQIDGDGHMWATIVLNGTHYIFDPQVEYNGYVKNKYISYFWFGMSESEGKKYYTYSPTKNSQIAEFNKFELQKTEILSVTGTDLESKVKYGTTVHVETNAVTNYGDLYYDYFYVRGYMTIEKFEDTNSMVYLGDYTKGNTLDWIPPESGVYTFCVIAYNDVGIADGYVTYFEVGYPHIEITDIITDTQYVTAGNDVAFKVLKTGGEGLTTIQLSDNSDGTEKILATFTTFSTIKWTPYKPGIYTLAFTAKDALNNETDTKEFTITVSDSTSLSRKAPGSMFIEPVAAGTTIGELKAMFINQSVTVTDSDGNSVSDELIATDKYKVNLNGADGTITDSAIVTVSGDVNSDGKTTAADARTLLRIGANLETASGDNVIFAGDLNKDGVITPVDARMALRFAAQIDKAVNTISLVN